MKFEKEILSDYSKLTKYVDIIKCRYHWHLTRNNSSATNEDFVNDGIILFYESNPEKYEIEALKHFINKSITKENKILKTKLAYDFDRHLEKPIVENLNLFTESLLNKAEDFLKSGAYKKTVRREYFILPDGRLISYVPSCKRYKLLNPFNRNGYLSYKISDKSGKEKQIYAHRMVVDKYQGGLKAGYVVHHKDENKHNNKNSNLKQITQKENIQHFHKLHPNHFDSRENPGKRITNIGGRLCLPCGKYYPLHLFYQDYEYKCKECIKLNAREKRKQVEVKR